MAALNNIKIHLRHDVLSNWTIKNPVLGNGEMAIVQDENNDYLVKIGNGISSFNELKYLHEDSLETKTFTADDITAKSIAQGLKSYARPYGLAAGAFISANADFSQAFGFNAETQSGDSYSFVWNGDSDRMLGDYYESHGQGTFSINPKDSLNGIYVGENSLCSILSNAISSVIEDNAPIIRDWNS